MRRILIALPLLLAPFPSDGAGDAALDRATLRGLKAVNVVIDQIAPEIQKEGVTPSALQSRLEEQLNRANIPVDASSHEFVAVRLTSVRGARGPYAVSMTIGLYQPVLLSRDKNVHSATQTWEVETVLMAEPKMLYRAAMDSIDDLANRFISAYRSVNQ